MKYLTPRPLRLLCLLLLLLTTFGVARQSAKTTFQTTGVAAGVHQQRPTRENSNTRAADTQARARRSYGQLPLSFEINRGQAAAQVKFLARNNGYNLFLTADEAVLALRGDGATTARRSKG